MSLADTHSAFLGGKYVGVELLRMFSLTGYCGQFSKVVSRIIVPISGTWIPLAVCPGF